MWKCRASAGYTTVNGGDRVETIVANGNVNTARGQDPDHALCAAGEAGGGNLPAPLGVPTDLLSAPSASAITAIEPQLGQSRAQRVAATARLGDIALRIPRGGAVVIGAKTAEALTSARCEGESPRLTGSSRVAGITLGGRPIGADDLAAELARLLSSTALVKVTRQETIRTPSSLTVRALHVVVRRGTSVLVDAVISEAKVGFDGAVCAPPSPPPPGPCPKGATYDAERNLCIIRQESSGSQLGDIIVGRPFSGPSGGTVIPLDIARKRYNSRCLSGAGNKFAQVGTRRSDRLTGTPDRDRILGRGGNDRIDGTSGSDCLDGGRGSDSLVGALGNDRSFGGSGRDHFNGGPGNDYLVGDAGNDTMNAAFGADRVFGGRGNDAINIATAGRRASADCGRGNDTVRLNRAERKRISHCENVHVFPGG